MMKAQKLKLIVLMTDGDEGRFVASSIFENKMKHQLRNSDFAILYRTNAQSRAMEDALRKKKYSLSYLWWFVFLSAKRNQRCLVLFAIGYQSCR